MSIIANESGGTRLKGYRREDGRLGIRNHLLVLSTVALTNRVAQLIAASYPGSLLITADFQRGLRGRDAQIQESVLRSLLEHPNTGGALVLVHDTPARRKLEEWTRGLGRPIEVMAFMENKGVGQTIEIGLTRVQGIGALLATSPQDPGHLGELTVALECGGSDATSSVCANPTIGAFVDRLIAAGGTAIVSETAEFIGAEAVVTERAVSPAAAQSILAAIAAREALMVADGEDYRGVNPTEENIAAGLTTLVEKSMGAVAKCGQSPLMGCLDFAQSPPGPGLWFMDTPFFSPVSLTGMVCGGAQIVLFGMGVFNPSGSPIAPTLKVCGNPHTVIDWGDAIDLDVSGIVDGSLMLEDACAALHLALLEVCAGEPSRAEHWGEGQIIAPRETASI